MIGRFNELRVVLIGDFVLIYEEWLHCYLVRGPFVFVAPITFVPAHVEFSAGNINHSCRRRWIACRATARLLICFRRGICLLLSRPGSPATPRERGNRDSYYQHCDDDQCNAFLWFPLLV